MTERELDIRVTFLRVFTLDTFVVVHGSPCCFHHQCHRGVSGGRPVGRLGDVDVRQDGSVRCGHTGVNEPPNVFAWSGTDYPTYPGPFWTGGMYFSPMKRCARLALQPLPSAYLG